VAVFQVCPRSFPSFPLTYSSLTTLPTSPEEEKKIIAALLGKLYVSPASSEDLVRDVYTVICDAVETQLLSDTASRNALYKIHVSLGKIVNALDTAAAASAGPGSAAASVAGDKYRRSMSRASSVGFDAASHAPSEERTVVQHEVRIKEEDEDDDDAGTVVHRTPEESLVDELLSEEEEL
jgi:condensin complex subunit 3